MKLTPALLRTLPLALTAAGMLWLAHAPAQADAVVRKASANSVVEVDTPTQWRELTPAQKKVLTPLERHWSGMDDTGRDKWINVANRFSKLSPAEQQRVQERMTQWSKLQPQERGEARLRFQQTRQLTADERQQKWAAYQALPAQDRQDLVQQAKRKAKPVLLADNMVGPREARQAYANKRNLAQAASDKKSNVVPNAMSSTAPSQTVVSPTMVKAGSGATTSLVTQRPTPPLHQHTGLTKITASKGFVDPVTLLPKKGAQSAAMASLPATATADQTQRR
ncbi:MAG: DUF3106 domain-containing protein [Aquabacterium sp.]|uniref:DUF3106 domain-containing protein n=1 Tax=Aquabacterium sp. TaxID=1872578 RepID=UPI0025BF361C|nr:DUF3106 domain-containing protein [Aquabacterium sp.]MBI5924014.1 DUF3106 domain-containing protein [Aquabacterium sp.]